MDPFTIAALTTLANQVIGILTPLVPFLNKARDAAVAKIGEDAYEEGKHLYHIVHDHFTKQNDGDKANKALQNFVDDPETYKTVLKDKLIPLLQADPNFATTLSNIIQTGPVQTMDFADDASIEDTHMNNELEQGEQTMKGGNRAKFKNVSMNIGRKREKDK